MPEPILQFQVPFGGRSHRYPYWERMDTCTYQRGLNLTQARPAKFLPVIEEDETKQLPIVMYPGTIVSVLNEDQTDLADFRAEKPNIIVPAHGHASGYTIVYGSNDIEHARYGSVYDVDGDGTTLVTSTGASSRSVLTTYPLGVVVEPIYSSALSEQRRNFNPQPKIHILSGGRVVRIPAITAEEKLIKINDLVIVSNTAGSHDPVSNPTTSYPGRWKRFDPTGAVAQIPLIVGRCVGKHRIATGTATAVKLNTDLLNGVALTNLNTDEDYDMYKRIQTVPGLRLGGSGTQGVPPELTFARSDANGDYWALDIALSVIGI